MKKSVCVSITSSEISLYNYLILLLVPSCNDQVILRADEPEELLKPATRERYSSIQFQSWFWRIWSRYKLYLPVDLPGLLNGGHCLDLLQSLMCFLLCRFHGLDDGEKIMSVSCDLWSTTLLENNKEVLDLSCCFQRLLLLLFSAAFVVIVPRRKHGGPF